MYVERQHQLGNVNYLFNLNDEGDNYGFPSNKEEETLKEHITVLCLISAPGAFEIENGSLLIFNCLFFLH